MPRNKNFTSIPALHLIDKILFYFSDINPVAVYNRLSGVVRVMPMEPNHWWYYSCISRAAVSDERFIYILSFQEWLFIFWEILKNAELLCFCSFTRYDQFWMINWLKTRLNNICDILLRLGLSQNVPAIFSWYLCLSVTFYTKRLWSLIFTS